MEDFYIQKALELAYVAAANGEIPVGAIVIDKPGHIIGQGYNQTEQKKSQQAHAEIIALERAIEATGDWRLADCTLYVTLEPCMMCFGFINLSRIKKVVYLADSPLFSVKEMHSKKYANHTCIVEKHLGSVPEATDLLKNFFKKIRE